MSIDKTFHESVKLLAEAIGDTDRSARYKNTDSDWNIDSIVYAFDYELKDGIKSSVYVAKDEDDIFEYIYIVGESFKVIYRITNDGATIRKVFSTNGLADDFIQKGIVSDIRTMALSAFSRSKKLIEVNSSRGGSSSGDAKVDKMPYRIQAGGVTYEAVQFKEGTVCNIVLEADSSRSPEEIALESFKAALISSVLSGKTLQESSYGYGTVEKAEITSEGVFEVVMSVEMPYSEDGEPKQVVLTIEVSPNDHDLIKVADSAFKFNIKKSNTKEEAISEGTVVEKEGETTTPDLLYVQLANTIACSLENFTENGESIEDIHSLLVDTYGDRYARYMLYPIMLTGVSLKTPMWTRNSENGRFFPVSDEQFASAFKEFKNALK
jgi:hypothetical protein